MGGWWLPSRQRGLQRKGGEGGGGACCARAAWARTRSAHAPPPPAGEDATPSSCTRNSVFSRLLASCSDDDRSDRMLSISSGRVCGVEEGGGEGVAGRGQLRVCGGAVRGAAGWQRRGKLPSPTPAAALPRLPTDKDDRRLAARRDAEQSANQLLPVAVPPARTGGRWLGRASGGTKACLQHGGARMAASQAGGKKRKEAGRACWSARQQRC